MRTASAVLAGTLALTSGASAVLAAGTDSTPEAPAAETDGAATVPAAETGGKEEVVYVMLDASGAVTGVYVVNSFAGGDIVDYGNYTDVRNLTTEDAVTLDGDKVTLHTDADKVYYQGDLAEAELPWNISLRYYMEGKEYPAEEIAGMSGSLEIRISITENTKCSESFWDGYALQASLTLDADKCKNIEAEDATIANVGSDKQLSYIILPGEGAELSITADVTDFEMDAVSINGVKLNLDLDMDESALTDKVKEIQDAIAELNDGALELADGAGTLSAGAADVEEGSKSLLDGAIELKDGAGSVDQGAASLKDGVAKVQSALDALNSQSQTLTGGSAEVLSALKTIQNSLQGVSVNAEQLSQLAASSTQIKAGIDALTAGLDTMGVSIDNYYSALAASGISDVNAFAAQNEQAASALGITDTQRALYGAYTTGGDAEVMTTLGTLCASGDAEATALYQQYSQSGDAGTISTYVATAGKLITVETLLLADASYIRGSDTVIAGVDASLDAQNGQLMTGALTLQSSYAQYDAVIQNMVASLGLLADNMAALKSGIDTLTANYETLDAGIGSYTSAVAQIREGYGQICQGSVSLADGTSQLCGGVTALADGADALYSGTSELYDGSVDLYDGTQELHDGTEEFRSETENVDTEISDKISETVDEMTGKNVETVSFVSEKNTNVDSVLFVIKTEAVAVPEEEEPEEQVKVDQNMWEKFLALFGIE